MSDATALALPDDELNPAALLQTLLDVSLTGIILFRPVYDTAGQQLIDLAYERLNPAAQQMLGLPERPAESLLTRFPAAAETGVFAFYRDAFLAGQLARHQFTYQFEGLARRFDLAAKRQGPLLVVSLRDTNDQPRTVLEQSLRESQALAHNGQQEAEQLSSALEAARAEAEHQRQLLQAIVDQAPVAIGYFEGPDLLVTAANSTLSAMWGRQQAEVVGRPLLEGVPELRDQGFEELMRQVRDTGVPFAGTETPAQMLRDGKLQTTYYNFVYQPLYDAKGTALGIIDVAVEVTEQVLARQALEAKERQTSFLNEQLQAANIEILANNAELKHTQQQLHLLNEELESRVAKRTSQLQEQQALLGKLLSNIPAAVAAFGGPDHQLAFYNDSFQHLLGGRPRLYQPVAESLPEVAEQGFVELLDQVYASGVPYAGEEIMVLVAQPTGPARQYHFNVTYQPLTDQQGRVQGILGFAVDVTAQVLARRQADTMQAAMLAVAQRQAQQREELFQIFAQTPVAIVLLREPDHRIDYYNPAFEALFPPEEWHGGPLRGHTIGEVYPRIREAGLVGLLDGVYQTGESQAVLDMPLADLQPGSPRYVTFAYQAYREAGSIVGVAAFVYDTTEQVLARRERDASQRLLEQTTNALPVLIGYLDQQQRFQFANQTYETWFGQRPAELLGRTLQEVATPERYANVSAYLAQALAGKSVEFEALIDFDQRGHRYIHTVYIPDVQQGQVVGCFSLATDITDQALARQQVQALNQELTAANANLQATNARLTRTNVDLDTFVYSASHDLKSPITNIEGLLLALRQQLPPAALDAELVPQLLLMMDGAVQRFQQTLGHLTDVSRLQQLAADQTAEAVDLLALVEAVRLDILPELMAAGATLTVDVGQCPTIYFSPKNLRSILYNLLSNAVKYRAPDRPPLVHLRCYPAGSQVVLEVQDNGLGLSEPQQRELFRLFRRLHSHVSGSGVGLYMVKKMVDNAGGSLTVQSQPGVGSTFTIALPVLSLPLA